MQTSPGKEHTCINSRARLQLPGQGGAAQPSGLPLPASPWPGSSAGEQVAESRLRAAGALLQLAVVEGVKLDVARDDLARAAWCCAAVS